MPKKKQGTRNEPERVREIRDRYTPKPVIFSSRQAVGDIEYLLQRADELRDAGEVLTEFVASVITALKEREEQAVIVLRIEAAVAAANSAFGLGPRYTR